MKTAFVDTNVLLDALLRNEGFWRKSLKIFQMAELGQIRACVSASSITDIFYVARKKLTSAAARNAIEKLLGLFEVVSVSGDDLRGALTIPIDDMEDALQAWCARKIAADTLVTRDVEGFRGIGLSVVTPTDFKA